MRVRQISEWAYEAIVTKTYPLYRWLCFVFASYGGLSLMCILFGSASGPSADTGTWKTIGITVSGIAYVAILRGIAGLLYRRDPLSHSTQCYGSHCGTSVGIGASRVLDLNTMPTSGYVIFVGIVSGILMVWSVVLYGVDALYLFLKALLLILFISIYFA